VKRFFIRLLLIVMTLLVVMAIAGGFTIYGMLSDLPDVMALKHYSPALTTTIWSRDGVLMAELAEENRYMIEPESLPPYILGAFIASEDGDFYKHMGLDFKGIIRAAIANLREGRVVQGGSTITQQVAKSLLLTPERSFKRKFREAALALLIENNLTKTEILRLYLNQIYLHQSDHRPDEYETHSCRETPSQTQLS
jgi:penicillin-binding protein 1A